MSEDIVVHTNPNYKPNWSFKDVVGDGGAASTPAPAATPAAVPDSPPSVPDSSPPEAKNGPAGAPSWSFREIIPQQTKKPATIQEQMGEFNRVLRGRDPDVDYASGAPWNVQLALARSDNPEEAQAALERRVGAGNYGQDKSGNWWVKQGDKKVAVRPQGGFMTAMENFGVDTAAEAPVIVGGLGGAVAGGAIGGPFGAVAGAGAGAMLGKGMNDLGKGALEGTYRKTPVQEAATLANEGALNMGLQGAGTVLKPVARGIGNAVRDFVGTTPKTRTTTARLLSGGARPPLLSAAPGAKSAQYDQRMRNLIMGDPDEKVNTKYIIQRAQEVLVADGVPPQQAAVMMNEILDQNARMSGSSVGQGILRRAQEHTGAMQAEAIAADREARAALADAEREFRDFAKGQNGRLGEQVADAIADSRARFGQRMSEVYRQIDNLAGNEPVVPITAYRNRARAMRMVLPPNELPPGMEMLADADPDIKLTFRQAHDLRSMYREMARGQMRNLTPTIRAHKALQVARDASEALDSAADVGDNIDLAGIANDNGLPASAVEALRKADSVYADGIAKYYNARMNALAKDARDGIFPDPNVVAKAILSPGHVEQARTILSLLPQNVIDQVARADAQNVIADTVDATGHIDGAVLREVLNDPSRRAVMDLVYPPQVIGNARRMADELAALNGKLDVRLITDFSSQGVQKALETSVAMSRETENFAKNNVVRALANPDPLVVDQAADALLSGGREMHLAAVRNFLGADSPEWKAVQSYALKKLLRGAVTETATLSKTLEGRSIDDALLKYTPEEQDILFPDGLKEDVRMLAKDAKFLAPKDINDQGASFAAAAIKSKLPIHIRAVMKYVEYKTVGWLASHPATLRFLADAERAEPGSARRLMGPIGRWIANAEDSGPGTGRPPAPAPTPQPQPEPEIEEIPQ
jgi:hypothetical protein